MIFAASAYVLGAAGRRIAGGILNDWFRPSGGRVFGNIPARLIFGLFLGAACLLGGGDIFVAAVVSLAGFLGTSIGNFDGIDLGRNGNHSWARAALGLWIHGLGAALLQILGIVALAHFGTEVWSWAVLAWGIAGLLIVPSYELGWRITGPRQRVDLPPGFQNGACFGEFFWGGWMGIAAYLTS